MYLYLSFFLIGIIKEEDLIELKECPVLEKILLFGNKMEKDLKHLTNLAHFEEC